MKRFLNSMMSVPKFARLNRVPENDDPGTGGAGGAGDDGKAGKGAATGGAGGAGDGDKKEKKETVSREDHERALADLNKFKRENEKFKQDKKDAETEKLKSENKWKELAEAKEKEASDARVESDRLKSSYLSDKKYNAVHAKCVALGIRAEAVNDLESLDLDGIEVETTSTGKINVLGAEKFATQLKARKPHWFQDKAKPNVNTNGTRVLDQEDGGEITPRDLLKAEAEAKKSGDSTAYTTMFKKFQQQRAANNRR